MAGNGAIAALVAITAPSGYVEVWAAPIIGAVAGVIVVFGVYAIDKYIDDPVGALSAHGLAGIWGTLACGLFTAPRLAQYNGIGDPAGGLFYSGHLTQLIAQIVGFLVAFAFVFALSWRCSGSSRGPTECASAPRKRTQVSTSPSTGCMDTRSSSSLRVSTPVHTPVLRRQQQHRRRQPTMAADRPSEA